MVHSTSGSSMHGQGMAERTLQYIVGVVRHGFSISAGLVQPLRISIIRQCASIQKQRGLNPEPADIWQGWQDLPFLVWTTTVYWTPCQCNTKVGFNTWQGWQRLSQTPFASCPYHGTDSSHVHTSCPKCDVNHILRPANLPTGTTKSYVANHTNMYP
jgi:hypothetical protein